MFEPGGVLWMSLTNGQVRYELSFYVTNFGATPVGGNNDYVYDNSGRFAPGLSSVIETFDAFGRVWAPYYSPQWLLGIISLWRTVDQKSSPVSAVPNAPLVQGTNTGEVPHDPPTRRIFHYRSGIGNTGELWLRRLIADDTGPVQTVLPATGGWDGRDQAIVDFMTGIGSGVCASDGYAFGRSARMTTEFDPLYDAMPAGVPALGDYLVSG